MYHRIFWTAERVERYLHLISEAVYRRRVPLPPFRLRLLEDGDEPLLIGQEVDDAQWPQINPGSYWGAWETSFVLRTTFRVPRDWPADLPLALYLPLGDAGDFSHPEALVYIDGEPVAGCDRHHQEVPLPSRFREGQVHLLALHGWTGLGGAMGERRDERLLMRPCYLVQVDTATREFIALARVALGVARTLDEDAPERYRLLDALERAFVLLDTREPLGEAFYASVPRAMDTLRAGIKASGTPMDVDLIAVGHAHLDLAWLWTFSQTRQKARRTYYTVLRLMEAFPEYRFTQSQPQLYAFVRESDPQLYEAIREKVAQGRWEPIGGMWVEADCNLTGAEALARQFLLGREFFRQEFGPGAETPVLWLPDVFGYTWSLPQLMREAGLKYFFTIKIGWNQYNRLPYDTFWWQGLDGTKVLTHFSTVPDPTGTHVSTYNAVASPEQVLGAWRNLQQKEQQKVLLMAYGHGDGGGGPTREMLENLRELRHFPGMPRVRMGTVREFFERLEEEVDERLPTWNGELYLEIHRGTYTTQARVKKMNRKSEFLLHDAEFLATLARLLDEKAAYPHARLKEAWQLLCRNQFHDVLPGSSIQAVYEDALRDHAEVQRHARAIIDEALSVIGAHCEGDVLVVNPTSFPRDDLVLWPHSLPNDHVLATPDGTVLPVQRVEGGTLVAMGEIPPYSVRELVLVPGAPVSPPTEVKASARTLENAYLRLEFDGAGDLVRVYDKEVGRDVLAPGAVGNQFQAFEDRPLNWDAWDIDIFYEQKMWRAEPAFSVRVVESGPLRATLEIRRRILNSTCVQRISLSWNSRRIDFDTLIDWQERHVLLKVAFPVDILAPQARYEIQWGNVERPTHRNTSWDWARFETVAHKWVDLSEGNYGVSLLNDCKYGYDVRDNVLRLSLLRGTTYPDPEADRGRHRFTYSLFPHPGAWDWHTVAQAYLLNDPHIVWTRPSEERKQARPRGSFPLDLSHPLLATDVRRVVVETIKWAEDDTGLIARLYEYQRTRGPVRITTNFPIRAAWRTNLLEENRTPLRAEQQALSLSVRPYEIVTLRIEP